MLPYSYASKKFIESRRNGFITKKPTSHWPTKEINNSISCEEDVF
jgi:hypothetical protein